MSKNLILIFVRNPELGECKKRLAKSVGNENALAIYKILLHHTASVIEKTDYHKAIYYTPEINENDIWKGELYYKFKQEGTDLGQRMMLAFNDSFKAGYDKVVIIGSDLFDLEPRHIDKAFQALDVHDVVIGPAEDGGYYLLGMKEMHTPIFSNKDWGSNSVRKDTLNDLSSQKVAMLEMLNDIDVYDDLKGYSAFLSYSNLH